MLSYIIMGFIGGIAVSSWHSFKDPPWEGFSKKKFFRSPIIGAICGILCYFMGIKELGLVLLVSISMERIVSEVSKGFLRKRIHKEFEKAYLRYRLNKQIIFRYFLGTLFLIGFMFLFYLNYLLKDMNPILHGFIGGTLVALAGAFKDAPSEGFKIRKFIRSPIVGIFSGLFLGTFFYERQFFILATIGLERLIVECYKTFIKKDVRGIFEGKEPKFKEWFAVRDYFFIPFFLVWILLLLLIII